MTYGKTVKLGAKASGGGKVTYKSSNAKVAKGSAKCLTVKKKTGKLTVRKGTKKGTYKVKGVLSVPAYVVQELCQLVVVQLRNMHHYREAGVLLPRRLWRTRAGPEPRF